CARAYYYGSPFDFW
nr:immunoglobulin heavy chain junction region [Mus musculus]